MTNGNGSSGLNKLHENMKEIKRKYDDWVNSGIDKELLEIYLIHKTKLSKKKVQDFLKNVDEFFDKLVGEEVAKSL